MDLRNFKDKLTKLHPRPLSNTPLHSNLAKTKLSQDWFDFFLQNQTQLENDPDWLYWNFEFNSIEQYNLSINTDVVHFFNENKNANKIIYRNFGNVLPWMVRCKTNNSIANVISNIILPVDYVFEVSSGTFQLGILPNVLG